MHGSDEWSKLETIQKISPDWKVKKLNQFSTKEKNSFVNGPFGSDLLSSELVEHGTPVVYIRDIKDGRYQRKSTCCVTDEKANSLLACKTSYGDVIITKVGDPPCEAAVYSDQVDAVVTQDVIRIKTTNSLLSYFLTYLLNSDIGRRQIKRIKIEGTRERVSLTDFKSIKFACPSEKDQLKIAQILSTWDKAIEKLEALIASKQQRKKALIQQLLTGSKRFSGFGNGIRNTRSGYAKSKLGELPNDWKVERIKKYFWYQEGPGVRQHQFTEQGVKLFNGTNIQFNKIDLSSTTTYISSEEANSAYKHFLADVGDLVIACSGISVDRFDEKIGFIDESHIPLCMNTSTMRFRSLDKEKSDIDYFKYFMQSPIFKNQIRRQITGSAQLNFGPSHVGVCYIVLPSIEEQRQISSTLKAADTEIETHQKQLAALKEQKKGLMQQLLTGKKRIKVDGHV